MTNDQDVFRRIGRGGAGNFFTPKQVEQASKDHASKDIEAQKPDHPVAAPSTGPAMARAGRGGAGNFVDRDEAAAKTAREDNLTAMATANGSRHTPRIGRGGAGNWVGDEEEKQRLEAERQGKAAELERQAAQSVDAGLQMPAQVHHGEEKQR
ncbi:hypothetical protein S7711_04372 [Stachybotrys chartarum IBT 7711]|uniref:Uncharacterized protein n=1 Tax=Stachybotrys chartarum (strain CBS 109288 / IBT 7711) TaxID=1280523 RepID=A0A084AY85_STACB|nr:hypothetical protein S7711_04372 [Stachybotrys chartarum IBT 7711]KFA55840.1 hypothetical protein S40293_01966 [Stachybotrys chartarum IBT 40293]KFA79565.1 hypothetical protein S40288_01125 [Stachybotrys chartarum IBT 40288]